MNYIEKGEYQFTILLIVAVALAFSLSLIYCLVGEVKEKNAIEEKALGYYEDLYDEYVRLYEDCERLIEEIDCGAYEHYDERENYWAEIELSEIVDVRDYIYLPGNLPDDPSFIEEALRNVG